MGKPDTLAWTSLLLAVVVAAIAVVLGWALWRERRGRPEALAESDRRYFAFQDLRRGFGIALMAVLALGVYVGSRLPTYTLEPREPGLPTPATAAAGTLARLAVAIHPNRQFLAVWMGLFSSVVLLLALALIDWIATRRYARRHRQAIDQERLELLRETIRHTHGRQDGFANGNPLGPR